MEASGGKSCSWRDVTVSFLLAEFHKPESQSATEVGVMSALWPIFTRSVCRVPAGEHHF